MGINKFDKMEIFIRLWFECNLLYFLSLSLFRHRTHTHLFSYFSYLPCSQKHTQHTENIPMQTSKQQKSENLESEQKTSPQKESNSSFWMIACLHSFLIPLQQNEIKSTHKGNERTINNNASDTKLTGRKWEQTDRKRLKSKNCILCAYTT